MRSFLPLVLGLLACLLAGAKAQNNGNCRSTEAIYAMDNQWDNRVYVYTRPVDDPDAPLTLVNRYLTGGSGFPDRFYPASLTAPFNPLGSTWSLTPYNGRWLFAVNAGSNSISTFKIGDDLNTLELIQITKTEGVFPTSVDARRGKLCVVTADGPLPTSGLGGHLECYSVDNRRGTLSRDTAFEGSADRTMPILLTAPGDKYYFGTPGGDSDPRLNGPITDTVTPGQVEFTQEFDALVVAVKGTGLFVYPIVDDQLTGPKIFYNSELISYTERGVVRPFRTNSSIPGGNLYAFAFTETENGRFLVAPEAVTYTDDNMNGHGGVVSFRFDPSKRRPLKQVSDAVGQEERIVTPCWIAADENGIYVSNTGGSDLSALRIGRKGKLRFTNAHIPVPVAPPVSEPPLTQLAQVLTSRGATLPIDIALARRSDTIYVLDVAYPRVVAFRRLGGGQVQLLGDGSEGIMALDPVNGVSGAPSGLAVGPTRCI